MVAASAGGFLAVLISLFALICLRPAARRIRLVDTPDHRKVHKGSVPLVGGLSAFAGLLVAWLISMPLHGGYGIFLLCSLLLVFLGAIDDARDIPAKFRLWAQVTLGLLLVYGSGVHLDTFGNLLGFGEISLGFLGPVITIVAILGAINAFNMIDGIDGLAGSMSLITLISLAVLFSLVAGFRMELALAVMISMALLPYLAANLGVRAFGEKIFMGDAGSMFIGFSVVWLLVNGSQSGYPAFRPVTALWIIAVPLIDMAAIMVRRYRKGESMIKPDRDHLHHIFIRAGFTDRQALAIISAIAALLATIGVLGEIFRVPEVIMLGGFLALFACYNWAIQRIWHLVVWYRSFSS